MSKSQKVYVLDETEARELRSLIIGLGPGAPPIIEQILRKLEVPRNAEETARCDVLGFAKKMGILLEINSEGKYTTEVEVYSPTKEHFVFSGTAYAVYSKVCMSRNGEPDFWRGILKDLKTGLQDCPEGKDGCEYCADVDSNAIMR